MKVNLAYTTVLVGLIFGSLVLATDALSQAYSRTNVAPEFTSSALPPAPRSTNNVAAPPPPPDPLTNAVVKAAIEAAEKAANDARMETAKAAQLQAEQNEKLFRSYLMLQEQLHGAVSAIEKNRTESLSRAEENTDALSGRLKKIESSLAQNQSTQMEAVESSNKLVMTVSVVFAGVGLLALVFTSWFQFRAMNRFAELSSRPTPQALPPHNPFPSLDEPIAQTDPAALQDPSYSNRLGSVIESLENRVRELEETPHGPLPEGSSTQNGEHLPDLGLEEDQEFVQPADPSDPIAVSISKGQTLLNLNSPKDALVCFEEALELDPNHTEAWIKKGTALERLNRLEEALDCYDQAIAADDSLTLAHLYKGGVYNQLERFSEALECYEQALRSQDEAATPESEPV